MSASHRRALALVPLMASACATTHVPLMMVVSRDLPTPCEIVLKGGERIPIDQGRVTPDSVVGIRHEGGRVAVARDSVVAIEEHRFDPESAIPLVWMAFMIPLAVAFATLIVKIATAPH